MDKKDEVRPGLVKPVAKEVKKEETVAEMLLRLLRGHGHIFNNYELKLLEKDSSSKKIIETYTLFKEMKKTEAAQEALQKK